MVVFSDDLREMKLAGSGSSREGRKAVLQGPFDRIKIFLS